MFPLFIIAYPVWDELLNLFTLTSLLFYETKFKFYSPFALLKRELSLDLLFIWYGVTPAGLEEFYWFLIASIESLSAPLPIILLNWFMEFELFFENEVFLSLSRILFYSVGVRGI
jgi:hypothetical protein